MNDVDLLPRLFEVRAGHLGEVLGDGVLWSDGTATVNWTRSTGAIEQYADLGILGAALDAAQTVVWLRQDTYIDQEA